MKTRIIPTILTDGVTVVKGEKFNNWRTVGSAEAIASLYASRSVDELLFLDVNARLNKTMININLLRHFSNVLDIPFTVGGGINTLDEAKLCFRQGAEKIVLGTEAVRNPKLISEIADVFGSQAVVVSLDFKSDLNHELMINSGTVASEKNGMEFVSELEELGAGEVLLQSCQREGTLSGMDFTRIQQVVKLTNLPVIASGGASSLDDFRNAILCGASAVAAGAIFQFTQTTPNNVHTFLKKHGINVRSK